MKESYGGAFSIWLFMVFFVIYVTFIGVAMQFAKTYRVKNHVINVLEQYQYSGKTTDSALIKLDSYLEEVPYTTSDDIAMESCESNEYVYHGVCIVPDGDDNGIQYKVTVYFVAEFPFLNLKMTIPVSGETKIIINN